MLHLFISWDFHILMCDIFQPSIYLRNHITMIVKENTSHPLLEPLNKKMTAVILPEWLPLLDSPSTQNQIPGSGTCSVQSTCVCNSDPQQSYRSEQCFPGPHKRQKKMLLRSNTSSFLVYSQWIWNNLGNLSKIPSAALQVCIKG